jgi:sulfur-oxidizing protein SoxA
MKFRMTPWRRHPETLARRSRASFEGRRPLPRRRSSFEAWLRRAPQDDGGALRIGPTIAILFFAFFTSVAAAEIPLDQRRSGYADVGRDTKAMQDDDTANPGMLWVLDGEAQWNAKAGSANKACADCHGDAAESMKGVAARYPAYESARARPVDLEERINICRGEKQNATPLRFESRELLGLTAYVARQSRGMPIAEASDPRLAPFVAAGRALFEARQGQINMSCAQCHDDNWGKQLAGNIVPQGQPTGYPIYRLEWQSLGSLQRRLRNCISGMRAETYDFGAPEYVALELFLMQRARGLAIETPGVRP